LEQRTRESTGGEPPTRGPTTGVEQSATPNASDHETRRVATTSLQAVVALCVALLAAAAFLALYANTPQAAVLADRLVTTFHVGFAVVLGQHGYNVVKGQ
jgi:hypothetical protein